MKLVFIKSFEAKLADFWKRILYAVYTLKCKSVGKRCVVLRITTPLERKRSFPRFSKKSTLNEGRQGNPKKISNPTLQLVELILASS
jgi:hypothetical protein